MPLYDPYVPCGLIFHMPYLFDTSAYVAHRSSPCDLGLDQSDAVRTRRSLRSRPLGQVLMPVYADTMEGFTKPLVILPIAHQDVSVMCSIIILYSHPYLIAESSHSFDPP